MLLPRRVLIASLPLIPMACGGGSSVGSVRSAPGSTQVATMLPAFRLPLLLSGCPAAAAQSGADRLF